VAINAQQARQMARKAGDAGVTIVVAMNNRFRRMRLS